MRLGTLAFMAFACALSKAAAAQVNIEALRTDFQGRAARAQIEASFIGRAGNVESAEAGAGAIGMAHFGRHGFFGSSRLDYTRFNHAITTSKAFVHLRYEYQFEDWLSGETFVQHQNDRFQQLIVREIIGAGPRFILVNESLFRIALGTSYMFEYERLNLPEGSLDAPSAVNHRSSSYLTGT